jgi:hypothetical protein
MPSIEFLQQCSGEDDFSAPHVATAAMPGNVTAGSLLVAHVGDYLNIETNFVSMAVTDTAGNTWRPLGARCRAASDVVSSQAYYALSAIAGATTITATMTVLGGINGCSFIASEFKVPTTLVTFAEFCLSANQNAPADLAGPSWVPPGPSLVYAGAVTDRSTFAELTGYGFTPVTGQLDVAGAYYQLASYAIQPNGVPLAAHYTWSVGSATMSATLAAFLDTAGFAPRPVRLGGRGAVG